MRIGNQLGTTVMCPGRAVEELTAQKEELKDVFLSGLYQHEYRHIDRSFPYPELTLAELGIPPYDVLHVSTGESDYYLEMEEA